jgi:hypothetical protein
MVVHSLLGHLSKRNLKCTSAPNLVFFLIGRDGQGSLEFNFERRRPNKESLQALLLQR